MRQKSEEDNNKNHFVIECVTAMFCTVGDSEHTLVCAIQDSSFIII